MPAQAVAGQLTEQIFVSESHTRYSVKQFLGMTVPNQSYGTVVVYFIGNDKKKGGADRIYVSTCVPLNNKAKWICNYVEGGGDAIVFDVP